MLRLSGEEFQKTRLGIDVVTDIIRIGLIDLVNVCVNNWETGNCLRCVYLKIVTARGRMNLQGGDLAVFTDVSEQASIPESHSVSSLLHANSAMKRSLILALLKELMQLSLILEEALLST